MQAVTYADLHCDSLTATGVDMEERICAVHASGCALQVFAVFMRNGNWQTFFSYVQNYKQKLKKHEQIALPVFSFYQCQTAWKSQKTACLLSAENIGFVGEEVKTLSAAKRCGKLERGIERLQFAGVRMASLCWNEPNAFAFPHGSNGGLTPLGRRAAHLLEEAGILIDVSHLSDCGVRELAKSTKAPLVASHSNAREVCGHSRNLPDDLIYAIAQSGGVIGINYYRLFVGEGDFYQNLTRHILHIIRVGGEDCVALGSDFDGIPPQPQLSCHAQVPAFLQALHEAGLPCRVVEKVAFNNVKGLLRRTL
jgi:membrane dipeptidase